MHRELCVSGRPHTCAPKQSFSNLNVYQHLVGILLNAVSGSEVRIRASDSAFLTSSQEMLILLVQGLHSE